MTQRIKYRLQLCSDVFVDAVQQGVMVPTWHRCQLGKACWLVPPAGVSCTCVFCMCVPRQHLLLLMLLRMLCSYLQRVAAMLAPL